MEKKKLKNVSAILKFTINKRGYIVDVKVAEGSNEDLGNASKIGLFRISQKLQKDGILIEPARLEDGTPVDIEFDIPLKYQIYN